MSQDPKVITTLQQRREIEQALKALGQTNSEEELAQRATEIARRGGIVVPALLALLGTPNLQLRGGLGHVARQLPRELIVPALRAAAGDPRRPINERMTAMTILERYLNEPLGPELFDGLVDPRQMALISLHEALAEFRRDPNAVMEYLTQLEEEPTEVALMLIEVMAQVEPAEVIPLLRMLALDPRPPVAQSALRQLGSFRFPEAAVALQSLIPNLPDTLKPLAERSLRKLALAGIHAAPDSLTWRTLISPISGSGDQSILFLCPNPSNPESEVISLWLNDQTGIQDILVTTVPTEQLPTASPVGHVHFVRLPQAGLFLLLEAPFDLGRAMLADVVALHHTRGQPLPMAYRLCSVRLWQTPWVHLQEAWPELELESSNWALARTLDLMKYPAFHSWEVRETWMLDLIRRFQQAGQRMSREMAKEIATRAFTESALQTLAARLRRMGRWLFWAQEMELAQLAMWTAAHLRDARPDAHPLLLYLAEKGLQSAWRDLSQARGFYEPDPL
ncbi:MAG: hypothetical protein RML36_12485 [Anaerolineae bacterium]|nr:hypothetical protein [Anaerolineae bacterium]MDW8100289.1 hypothetical protein [Anaerolineae bacterium]